MTTEITFVPKELETRNGRLFDLLVPAMGETTSIEGETLRALNRVIYRFYNDGDVWWKGYGCETAGPAAAFLASRHTDMFPELWHGIRDSEGREDNAYIEPLIKALEHVVSTIEEKMKAAMTANPGLDMLEFEAKYEDEGEDDWYGEDE